ncbi:MAG: hypothetical protein KJ607_05990 [Bacteroidetes bacterium]|nr:hypothetical protein [Bacteroidota bacterium]
MVRFDKFLYGIIIGALLPAVTFMIIYFINKEDIQKFGNLFIEADLHISAFTLSIVPDLIVFYIFINRQLNRLSKGILLMTFVYLILFVALFI